MSETTDIDTELKSTAEALIREKFPLHLGSARLEFNRTLECIWSLVQLGNQYIDKTEPWVLAKNKEPDESCTKDRDVICLRDKTCTFVLCHVQIEDQRDHFARNNDEDRKYLEYIL